MKMIAGDRIAVQSMLSPTPPHCLALKKQPRLNVVSSNRGCVKAEAENPDYMDKLINEFAFGKSVYRFKDGRYNIPKYLVRKISPCRNGLEYNKITQRKGHKMESTFEITSGSICVSDPAYKIEDHDDSTIAKIYPAQDGTWSVEVIDNQIIASHPDYVHLLDEYGSMGRGSFDVEYFNANVETGQISVYDLHSYTTTDFEVFYKACCDASASERQWGCISTGVITQIRYGDGGYPVKVYKNKLNGKAIAVVISLNDPYDDPYDDPDYDRDYDRDYDPYDD